MAIPDHPGIARTIATGYPRPFHSVRCTSCMAEFTGGHKLYRYGGELLCEDCFRTSLLENTSTDELADAFEIDTVRICCYNTNMEE